MNKTVYNQQTMFLHRTRYKNDFPFLLPLHKEQVRTNTQKKQEYFVYLPIIVYLCY